MADCIDRERIISILEEKIECIVPKADGKHYITVEAMLEFVRNVSAADVVEVRHGRWIKDGEDGPVYCSECGEEHEWGDYRATYCDTCGAKMDGGQEDE